MPTLPPWFGVVVVIFIVVFELLFCALPALLWAVIGRQKLVEAFAWRRASGREYAGALLLAVGFAAWVQVLIALQSFVWPQSLAGQQSSNAFLLPLIQQYPVAMILATPLSAAFSEELFFRGVLQRALVKRMPVWSAVGLASLLFAAIHFDLSGLIVRTLLGILLAIMVLRGRSIFPAMLTHFVYDAVVIGAAAWDIHAQGLSRALHQASRADSGLSRTTLIGYAGAGTLLMAAGVGLCVGSWRRKQEKVIVEEIKLWKAWPIDQEGPKEPEEPEESVTQ